MWYPSYDFDIPLFGIDLISLGRNRSLIGIDFIPLRPQDQQYSSKYISPYLEHIRPKHDQLHDKMTKRFYDGESIFSEYMLLGKFKYQPDIETVVKPAVRDYMNAYMNLVSDYIGSDISTPQNDRNKYIYTASTEESQSDPRVLNKLHPRSRYDQRREVKKLQQEYDVYNAKKDPAIGIFNSYFGTSWSDSYVHDFLFDLSRADLDDFP